eukprot:TRINITY_DN2949_c0_g1_i2.p1 TRINITY_DN2949_c0_g1~~TRINITY_DN2949_c0_g1_i2.p1  ORF type:complete len:405 (-),score=73.83 TRINITY_DN2949_c0_g1_i2:333-1547(-)
MIGSNTEVLKTREILSKYKSKKCRKPEDQCKFKTFAQKDTGEIVVLCTGSHNNADDRRPPFADTVSCRVNYSNELCEQFDINTNCCPHTECTKCRNQFEYNYHPENFKKMKCPYFEVKKFCRLGVKCFRYHEKSEHDAWRGYWEGLKVGNSRSSNQTSTMGNMSPPLTFTPTRPEPNAHGARASFSTPSDNKRGELLDHMKDARRFSTPVQGSNTNGTAPHYSAGASDYQPSSSVRYALVRDENRVGGGGIRALRESDTMAGSEKDILLRNLIEQFDKMTPEDKESGLRKVEEKVDACLQLYMDYKRAIQEYRLSSVRMQSNQILPSSKGVRGLCCELSLVWCWSLVSRYILIQQDQNIYYKISCKERWRNQKIQIHIIGKECQIAMIKISYSILGSTFHLQVI